MTTVLLPSLMAVLTKLAEVVLDIRVAVVVTVVVEVKTGAGGALAVED